MIPYGRQNISEEDIQSVVEVLRSDFLTQGPIGTKFEKAVANYCGVKHGIAVNSATSALHLACLALEVGPGDIVWTSAITFVASANCALYCGAKVDFIDIDPITYNISVDYLEEKLIEANKNNCLPKVVIPVHLCGQSCDMEKIHVLSQTYGFKIIEDASHAIGGKYKRKPIGNCKYSDITVFSFHPVKIITTGEGGMLMTNKASINQQVQRLRSHGITRDPEELTHAPDGPWYYQQLELGFNYRMTDILATLGLNQLKRLDQFVKERHAIVNSYQKLFADFSIILPDQDPNCYSAFHLYVVRIPKSETEDRKMVFERLRASGILVNLHYIPVYHHPYYQKFGYQKKNFPQAEKYYSEAISLPIYPGLTEEQIKMIVDTVTKPLHHQTIF
jgi:UDP-4-amino-4,6-dideoxy-N-acetyl-beta-L-altrosamine transaminase